MGRMSFTLELKELATANEAMDAGGCWREVLTSTATSAGSRTRSGGAGSKSAGTSPSVLEFRAR
jgi:hypothetical protein